MRQQQKKQTEENITDLRSGGRAPVSLLDHRRRMLRKLPRAKGCHHAEKVYRRILKYTS